MKIRSISSECSEQLVPILDNLDDQLKVDSEQLSLDRPNITDTETDILDKTIQAAKLAGRRAMLDEVRAAVDLTKHDS